MTDESVEFALERQGSIIKAIAQQIVQAATSQLGEWIELIFDHREDADSGSGTWRIVARSALERKWIEEPSMFFSLRDELLELRDQFQDGHWYGLSIHIQRSGEVDVAFNYDPDCIETFDEDEERQSPF